MASLRPQPFVPPSIRRLPSPKPPTFSPAPAESNDKAAPEHLHSAPRTNARPSLRRSRPRSTGSSSRCRARPTRSCVAHRISCDTPFKRRSGGDLRSRADAAGGYSSRKPSCRDGASAPRRPTARRLAPCARGDQAGSLGTRRRPVRIRGPTGRCTERGFLEFHHVVPTRKVAARPRPIRAALPGA